jgi:nucleoside-diphosphate-sugar epimerase
MRLLVLGGTKFLGRAVVGCGLARGHEVTLFNRGRTNPDLFSEAEKLRGDRLLDETVRAAFERAKPTADAGLMPEREAGLLQAWRLRRQQGRGRGGTAPSTSVG